MRYLIIVIIILMVSCGKEEVRNTVPEDEKPAELLEYAKKFYENGDYENAFRAYGIIYYNYPTSREYIDAAIGLSKSYGALDNYEKQFDILYGLIKENLVPSRVPEIYNIIAGFYEESAGISEQLTGAGTTDYQTAIEYYKKSIEYPNSNDMNAKGFAQYRIGRLHEDLENYQNAFEAYKTVATQYEGTEWAVRADQSIDELSATLQRRKEYQEKGLLPDTTTKASTAPVSSEPEMPIEQMPPEESATPRDTSQTLEPTNVATTDTSSVLPDSLKKPEAPTPPEPAPTDTTSFDTTLASPDTTSPDTLQPPKLEFK